jgi:hypothetical protein
MVEALSARVERGAAANARGEGVVPMKDTRRTFAAALVALALVFAAVLVGRAAANPGSMTAATETGTFTDAAGDGGGAPDITAVTVTDDPATRALQITATAAGYSTISPTSKPTLLVWLNVDKNDLSGSAGGWEYLLMAGVDPGGPWYDVRVWAGSGWGRVPESPTMSASRDGDTQTWRLGRTEVNGMTTGLTLYAESRVYDASGNIVAHDVAPDTGKYTHDLSVKPVIGAGVAVPYQPKAGKKATVTFGVIRGDNFRPLTTGTMVCDPSVKGKVIPHAESFTNGQAKVSFTVPKTAKGKVLTVKLTVTVGEQSATQVATFKVK